MSFYIHDSYPYLENMDNIQKNLTEPFPYILFRLNNLYPYLITGIDESFPSLVEPFPLAVMISEPSNKMPHLFTVDEVLEYSKPYSYAIMIQEQEEMPKYNQIKDVNYGAFIECTQISSVTFKDIPIEFGDNSFSGCDRLTEVKINSESTFKNTTFPENCTISYF